MEFMSREWLRAVYEDLESLPKIVLRTCRGTKLVEQKIVEKVLDNENPVKYNG